LTAILPNFEKTIINIGEFPKFAYLSGLSFWGPPSTWILPSSPSSRRRKPSGRWKTEKGNQVSFKRSSILL